MITIQLKMFKYGSYKESKTENFLSREEFVNWLSNAKRYTEKLKKDSQKYGEDLEKWTASFEYEGFEYNISLDI
jgi:hypothetical protein